MNRTLRRFKHKKTMGPHKSAATPNRATSACPAVRTTAVLLFMLHPSHAVLPHASPEPHVHRYRHQLWGYPTYEIALAPVVLLRTLADAGPMDFRTSIVQDSRGGFLVGPTKFSSRLFRFAGTGALLDSAGPASAIQQTLPPAASLYISPGDTLHVLDVIGRKWMSLSPGGSTTRTVDLSSSGWLGRDFFIDRDGTLVVQAQLFQRHRIGIPVHRIDANGIVTSSFGGTEGPYRADDLTARVRIIAPAGTSGQTWVATVDGTSITLWGPGGLRTRVLPIRNYAVYPERLSQLWDDGRGHLWMFFAREGHQAGQPDERHGIGETSRHSTRSTTIHVVDSRSGVPIASREFDRLLVHIGGTEHVYGISQDGFSAEVWQLRLVWQSEQ